MTKDVKNTILIKESENHYQYNRGGKMKILFWSGTGNTETMARLISKGIKDTGKEVELINISHNTIPDIKNESIIVLGCPSMGEEELEESEFLPFFESIEPYLNGKKVLLFGSYGWGNGQWMRNWEERVQDLGAVVSLDPIIINYAPEGDTETECIDYGKQIAKL